VRRVPLVAGLAALGVTACALVLGIDDPPLRPDRDSGPDSAPDAADACVPSAKAGCACASHDFCDDFDTDGEAPFSRWKWDLDNPFVKRDGSIELGDGGLSEPLAARTAVETDGASAYAMVLDALDFTAAHPGRPFRGVRLTFWVRLESLDVTEQAGPVEGGSAYVGAVLQLFGTKPGGASILIAPSGMYLGVSTNVTDSNGTAETAPIYDDTAITVVKANWIPVEIVVAERDKAIELGYDACQEVDAGPGVGVAAASVLSKFRACLPLAATFGGVAWASKPVVAVGGGTFGAGSILVRHDNVSVDFL
jgi:hypothetical protein